MLAGVIVSGSGWPLGPLATLASWIPALLAVNQNHRLANEYLKQGNTAPSIAGFAIALVVYTWPYIAFHATLARWRTVPTALLIWTPVTLLACAWLYFMARVFI